jgi:hypothetical protein
LNVGEERERERIIEKGWEKENFWLTTFQWKKLILISRVCIDISEIQWRLFGYLIVPKKNMDQILGSLIWFSLVLYF